MNFTTIRILLAGAICLSCQRSHASDKNAAEILAEIDSIRKSAMTARNDPEMLDKLRKDAAARKERESRQFEARRRIDDLTWIFYEKYPDHERVPSLLRSRWMYRMRSAVTADETLAEIDRVLAEAKNPRLVVDIAFLRAEAILRKYRGCPAMELMNHSMPALEAAIARAPRDNRGASLLYAIMMEARGVPERKSIEIGDRILRDYPTSTIAGRLRKSRVSNTALGSPLTLDFKDAISGSDVSLASMRGKVVVVDFWATWCGPCVADMQRMKELYAKYRGRGVEFVGVSLDRSPEDGGLNRLREFVASNGIQWPQYYEGAPGTMKFSERCGVQTIPVTFILDKAGNLASTDAHGKIDQILQELLKP